MQIPQGIKQWRFGEHVFFFSFFFVGGGGDLGMFFLIKLGRKANIFMQDDIFVNAW